MDNFFRFMTRPAYIIAAAAAVGSVPEYFNGIVTHLLCDWGFLCLSLFSEDAKSIDTYLENTELPIFL